MEHVDQTRDNGENRALSDEGQLSTNQLESKNISSGGSRCQLSTGALNQL